MDDHVVTTTMRYQDLNKFEQLTKRDSEQQRWQALIELEAHLDDVLAEIDATRFKKGTPCRLSTVQIGEDWLYIAAGDDGRVYLGRVDNLADCAEYRLGSFDPSDDEIITLAITAGQRFTGTTHDLWITVLRYRAPGDDAADIEARSDSASQPASVANTSLVTKKPKYMIYHAVLGLDHNKNYFLRPAQDDASQTHGTSWQPQVINASLPDWLIYWNFAVPSAETMRVPSAVTRYLPNEGLEAIDAACWSGGLLCYSQDHIVHLFDTEAGLLVKSTEQVLPERAYCLACYKVDEAFHVIVGCDDNSLRFLVLPDCGELTASALQHLEESPVALSVVTPSAQGEDLLVLDRNGWLRRWRRLEPGRIQRCWNALWQAQCASHTLPHWLSSASTWLETDKLRKHAIAHHALDCCLQAAAQADAMQREHFLALLLPLFRVFRQNRGLPRACLDRLIDSVRQYLDNARPAYPLTNNSDFAATLLFRLYTEECQLADRSRIGMEFIDLPVTDDAGLKSLRLYRRPDKARQSDDDPNLTIWNLSRRLEHWANALWPTQEDQLKEGDIVEVCGLEAHGKQWLVCATREALHLYQRQAVDVALQFIGTQRLDTRVLAITALPIPITGQQTLVVAVKRNKQVIVEFFRVNSSNLPCLTSIGYFPIDNDAFSVVLAACPESANGNNRLVILANQKRYVWVYILTHREDGTIDQLGEMQVLETSWVHAADLAVNHNGYWLIACSDQATVSRLYHMNHEGHCEEKRRFNVFHRGNLAACFDDKNDPHNVLIGGRGGYLLCIDLQCLGKTSDICWVYRQQGAILFIRTVEFDGKRCFLVGSRNGDIVLLRADNGQRLWKIRLPYGALHAWVYKTPSLHVIVHQGQQRLTTFIHNNPLVINEILRETQAVINNIALHTTDEVWRWSRTTLLHTIYRIKYQRESLRQALNTVHYRDGRPRLLRYALQEPSLQGQITETIPNLGSRELALLLNYAGKQDTDFLPAISLKLCHHHRQLERRHDRPTRAVMAAMATWLQHWRGHKPKLSNVLEYLPPNEFFLEFNWVNRAFALLLLDAVQREIPSGQEDLLPYLLEPLLRLPPFFVGQMYPLLNPNTKDAEHIEAVLRLLDVSATDAMPEKLLQRLAECFARSKRQNPIDRLFAALLNLHGIDAEKRGEVWDQWRRAALEAMSNLRDALADCQGLEMPLNTLVEGLRHLLLDEAMPEDTAPREQRLDWLARLKNKLNLSKPPVKSSAEPDWQHYLLMLVYSTGKLLERHMDYEYQHLLDMVRPRLSLLALKRDANNRVNLSLRTEPEPGDRRLHDVTVIYSADLQVPGLIRLKRTHRDYPDVVAEEDLHFDGFLLNQTLPLQVQVDLIAGSGYSHQDVWYFALPQTQQDITHPLPAALAAIYRDFCHTVFSNSAPLVVLSIDRELGQTQLLLDWDARFPHCRLDVDSLLREQGFGRQYTAASLDLERLEPQLLHQCGELKRRSTGNAPLALLLGPLDESVERLLSQTHGEAMLINAVQRWRQLTEKSGMPPLRLLLSSSHASRLRGILTEKPPELVLHRHLQCYKNAELEQDLFNWLAQETTLSPNVISTQWDSLNKDLRLLWCWWRAVQQENQEGKGAKTPATDSIDAWLATEDVQTLLRETLRGLSVVELAIVIVGTESASALDGALKYHQADIVTACSNLKHLGLSFVSENGDFSTRTPYRKLIQELYWKHVTLPPHNRDLVVFASLLPDHEPGELLRPQDLASMNIPELQKILPNCTLEEECHALIVLARCWVGLSTFAQNAIDVFKHLIPNNQITPMPLTDIEHWSQPLLSLGLPCLRVGGIHVPKLQQRMTTTWEPETYVFWLNETSDFYFAGFCKIAADTLAQRQAWLKNRGYVSDVAPPRLIITGPGCEALPPDNERRVALWRFADYSRAAWRGQLAEGLQRCARKQLRLAAFSPYQISGALPPGSPLFVGREEELAYIEQRITHASLMIVGGRRVGKTSLLNQVHHQLQQNSAVQPIYLDLQHIKDKQAFYELLRYKSNDADWAKTLPEALRQPDANLAHYLDSLTLHIQRQGKLAVFLLNEIDRIAERDPSLLKIFRGLNDSGQARFLFTGYAILGQLGMPSSPFFNFAQGMHFDGRAISLAALSGTAAEKLLDLLEQSPLLLRWRNAKEKREAYDLLLQRSYCIPWVVQRYAQLLVERSEQQHQDELCLDHVHRLLDENGSVVWRYISDINFSTLDQTQSDAVRHQGLQLALYAVARRYYFQGDADMPVRNPLLNERRALDLGFSHDDVQVVIQQTAYELLQADGRDCFLRWLEHTDLRQALRLLTLTLILEPDPIEPDRYGFLLHIFPLELHRRHGDNDPNLNELFIKTAAEFARINLCSGDSPQ